MMEFGRKYGLKKVLFSSTGGAIYGEQDYFPADEKHPMQPLSPYGITKLVTEKYLFFYKEIYGIDHVILRYANIYGPRQNPHGEAGVVAIFTQKMLKGEQPIINGEGKQTRDYVFVGDVVQANLLGLKYSGSNIFNIGTGIETNVNQLFHHIKTLTGAKCEEKHIPAKAGEQMRSVISSKKIGEMLGAPKTEAILNRIQKAPGNYAATMIILPDLDMAISGKKNNIGNPTKVKNLDTFHCYSIDKIDKDYIYLINPNEPDFPEKISKEDFSKLNYILDVCNMN